MSPEDTAKGVHQVLRRMQQCNATLQPSQRARPGSGTVRVKVEPEAGHAGIFQLLPGEPRLGSSWTIRPRGAALRGSRATVPAPRPAALAWGLRKSA